MLAVCEDGREVRGADLARLIAGTAPVRVGTPRGVVAVEHRFGTTLVPHRPRRVVSLGYEEQDLLLHFGVVPVLQRDYFGDQPDAVWPWSRPMLGGARPMTFRDDIPFDAIRALAPDLVMATNAGLEPGEYRALSAIAPTVADNGAFPRWETPRDQMLLDVGRVFGQAHEAQLAVDRVRLQVLEVAEAHPEWRGLEAVSVTTTPDGRLSVDCPGHARGQLLLDLGFSLPVELLHPTDHGEGPFAFLEHGRLPCVDRDVVLWVNGEDDPSAYVDLPGRRQLAAHREGREVYVDKHLTAAFTIQSPRAVLVLLDELVPLLEAAVAGPHRPVPSSVRYGIAPPG